MIPGLGAVALFLGTFMAPAGAFAAYCSTDLASISDDPVTVLRKDTAQSIRHWNQVKPELNLSSLVDLESASEEDLVKIRKELHALEDLIWQNRLNLPAKFDRIACSAPACGGGSGDGCKPPVCLSDSPAPVDGVRTGQ